MKKYNHKLIESKWQKMWEEKKLHKASNDNSKKKYYPLVEFPYPSGDGLHVGHPRPYIALDIIARKRRAEGYNVLYPFGWDAFGLPTENYAVKTGTHPKEVTKKNTERFKKQVKMLGLSFDWSREINTTDPKYYKWTQWIFLKLFEHGLAYKKKMPVNWCLECKTILANEEVVDGLCERCGSNTEKREKEQWLLKITDYADRLHDDLDTVDYEERIKIQQKNWIGRSEGAEIEFQIQDSRFKIPVFTTRPDTLFGATYIVLAPENKIIKQLLDEPNQEVGIKNKEEVVRYIEQTKKKTEIERTAEGKEKTGVELNGVQAINPANNKEIPVWIADYVLAQYGTGAIMAVPAHDERDFAFAEKNKLPIRKVVLPPKILSIPRNLEDIAAGAKDELRIEAECWTGEGELVNSDEFDGLNSNEAKEKITAFVKGEKKTTYKLRDWVFSRQRYWGEPIPLVFCNDCRKQAEELGSKNKELSKGELLNPGWVSISEEELPVELPDVEKYQPLESGESPLAKIEDWVTTRCPKCGGKARRETDTMPTWAGSSWYFLRYTDSDNNKELASKDALQYWTPVDWYNGGMEHTTLHLLYSRFWHKFLFDIKVVPTSEPYKKRTSHGLILAESGEKMSKSKGNVINPDDIVELVGADAFRLYEMFMGPFDQAIPWNTDNIAGVRRFLEKVWRLQEKIGGTSSSVELLFHKSIKKVSEDIETLKFNTAVSTLMIFSNSLAKLDTVPQAVYETFLLLLAPFAPHMTDEIWETLGHADSIHKEPWPSYDEAKIEEQVSTIVVQVDGKTRATIEVGRGTDKSEIEKQSVSLKAVQRFMEGREIKQIIHVPGRLVNIVVKDA